MNDSSNSIFDYIFEDNNTQILFGLPSSAKYEGRLVDFLLFRYNVDMTA